MAVNCHTRNESNVIDLHDEAVMSDSLMIMHVTWVLAVTARVASRILWEDFNYGIVQRQMFLEIGECQNSLQL